ncbi:1-phosphofructokinase family hexose kinase [Lysinibacter cavernae]|uniref:1-phosphofructokinase n=1 Tax=Lysinibacter cavernae TaxID=1640652 RepID=A0A7X5R039_9MICO|nr:hexose kinase [Lysinibacter cavernae]NIH53164.1 1-phosphofructokinase [Lysinibacter cavernae]
MSAIVTVTPSAAIDQTYVLPELAIGEVNRASSAHTELSGKGVNVAHAIALGGTRVSAVLTLGENDQALATHQGEHVASRPTLVPVIVPGPTRVNTSIIDSFGRTTKINQSPIPLSDEHWGELHAATLRELESLGASWLVVCGSIPTNTASDELVPFADLLAEAHARGIRTALDTSGQALRQVLQQGAPLTLIKPNTHELADLLGRSLVTIGDVIDAANELRASGVEMVYVSMGEDGALAVAKTGVWWAKTEATSVVNSAGAGDASLAGFITGLADGDADDAVPRAIATAASWGALSVSQQTTLLSALDEARPATVVAAPDRSTLLADPAEVAHA